MVQSNPVPNTMASTLPHDCASVVGGMAGLVTSLTVTLNACMFRENTMTRKVTVTLVSVGLFAAVNTFQHRMKNDEWVTVTNGILTVVPQIMYLLWDMADSRKHQRKSLWTKTQEMTQLLTMTLVPLVVFYVSSNQRVHTAVCRHLHKQANLVEGLTRAKEGANLPSYKRPAYKIPEYNPRKYEVPTTGYQVRNVNGKVAPYSVGSGHTRAKVGGNMTHATIVIPGRASVLNTASTVAPLNANFLDLKGYIGSN